MLSHSLNAKYLKIKFKFWYFLFTSKLNILTQIITLLQIKKKILRYVYIHFLLQVLSVRPSVASMQDSDI